jgi:hypothetical protein
MPRVFVVNEPLRKDETTGALARFLPVERAAEHGELVRLTPDGSPPGNLTPWLRTIYEGLERWEDGDFLVLVGDQALLAYASSVVGAKIAAATGPDGEDRPTFRVLKWSRHKNGYDPLSLELSMATKAPESLTKTDA